MRMGAKFSSKFGAIAATIGSAVGLGTVWRFPNEVQDNGGAAFLIIYLVCMLLMGIPVMLAEFSIGRNSAASGNTQGFALKGKWQLSNAVAVLAAYLILIFYLVVAGWTIEYLWYALSGTLYSGIPDTEGHTTATAVLMTLMQNSLASPASAFGWTAAIIFLNLFVLLQGVSKGIERMANVLMPLLFVILVVLCGVSLSLPNASEGVEFFLKPDFSAINGNMLIDAVGQTFFSLSLGMGILVTYSSYFPSSTRLTRTATTVSLSVFAVAILMGLIIFPAVKSFGITTDTQGPTLIFITLPEIFRQMPGSAVWASLFFALLAVAALTSTVSIAEVPIAFLCNRFKWSRRKACLVVLLPMFVLSGICALSHGPLADATLWGLTMFDLLDYLTANIMLPAVAVCSCIYVGYVLPSSVLYREMTNNGTMKSTIAPILLFIIRYIAPLLIVATFVPKLIESLC